MATLNSSNRLTERMWAQNAPRVERVPDIPPASPSLLQDLGHFVRVLLGALLLILGLALMSTLVLLPLGLPLSLLGAALITAPRSP